MNNVGKQQYINGSPKSGHWGPGGCPHTGWSRRCPRGAPPPCMWPSLGRKGTAAPGTEGPPGGIIRAVNESPVDGGLAAGRAFLIPECDWGGSVPVRVQCGGTLLSLIQQIRLLFDEPEISSSSGSLSLYVKYGSTDNESTGPQWFWLPSGTLEGMGRSRGRSGVAKSTILGASLGRAVARPSPLLRRESYRFAL